MAVAFALGFLVSARAQSNSSSEFLQKPLVAYNDLIGDLPEVPFSSLSDQAVSPAGRRALGLRPATWKHAESHSFILHFIQNATAKAAAIEAESDLAFIAANLGVAPPQTGKAHLYLFEDHDSWTAFLATVHLEQWIGAFTEGNEIFVQRNPKYKFKGHAMAHELVHLMIRRFIGTSLPLWLEEGTAEDLSISAYSSFYRRRGYGQLPKLPVTTFIPLARLTSFTRYPEGPEVEAFYRESSWLAGFLNSQNNQKSFLTMVRSMARGSLFDSALREAFGSRWLSLDSLEADFKTHLARTTGRLAP